MKNGRFWRNKFSILAGTIALIICIFLHVSPKLIKNYTDFISGILSFSSIVSGFLVASFALVPALPNSKLIKILRRTDTDLKLLDRMLITIFSFFICSLFSLIMLLFFNLRDTSIGSKIILDIVFTTFTFSITESFEIIRILLKVIGAEFISNKKKDN